MAKQPWQMTQAEYVDAMTINGEYAEEYREMSSDELSGPQSQYRQLWIDAIASYINSGGAVDERVADSLWETVGKVKAWAILRRALASGAMAYVPPEARDYTKTYRQYLQAFGNDGIRPRNVRDLHRAIVRRAITDGRNVPAEVLAEYPELTDGRQNACCE